MRILALTILLVLTGTAPASAGFVTRSGTALYLDGGPFVFTGLNEWNANSRPGNQACGYQPDVLADLAAWARGRTVMRAWFFQMFATTSDGDRDWSAFDQTLAAARARDVKVIAVLADQWDSCESTFKTASWYRTDYAQAILPKDRLPYREWVAEAAARYAGDDTIMAWELVNEAEVADEPGSCAADSAAVLRDFVRTVARTIRSVDRNHLIAPGVMGGGQCGADDINYATVHSPTAVSLCTYHDYGAPETPLPGDAWNGLARRIEQCNEIGKPLVVDESGILLRDSAENPLIRASYFWAKRDAAFARGVAGYLLWAFNDEAHGGSIDDYGIGAGDPALGPFSGTE